MNVTTAMILAAGLGTRMRPLTLTMPKPLIPVGGKALIDWNLDWLEAGGIHRVVMNSSYLAAQLEAHVAARPQVSIVREGEPPLETGGGVANALPLLASDCFLTMNADAILPLVGEHPIHSLTRAWDEDVDFLLLLVPRTQAIGWQGNGDFIMDAQGRIRRPQPGEDAPLIFTGVELMHRRAFADCPAGAFSLSALWKRGAGADGFFARLRGVLHEGPWLNVGDLAGLAVAEDYFAVTGKRT